MHVLLLLILQFLVTDVFVTGRDGAPNVRIPGMTVTAKGTILAFAEGRPNDIDPGAPGAISLLMRRSTDGGRSWQPIVTLKSDPRFDYANPVALLDRTTGTVWLAYDRFPDACGSNADCNLPGNDPEDTARTQTVWVISSADDGVMWSEPMLLPKPVVTGDGVWWRSATVGPGSGIQLTKQRDAKLNGRLVIPGRRIGSRTEGGAGTGGEPFIFYSDDHGKSWKLGGVTAGAGANEPEVVELQDGRLMMDGRQNTGNHRYRWWSEDGGMTWSNPSPGDITLTPVDASLIRLRDGRLAFTAPIGPGRANLGLWIGDTDGKSFKLNKRLSEGFAAYSVVAELADGELGVLYEATGADRIVFLRVRPDQ